MTNPSFVQLVDIGQIRQLLEAHFRITGILSAILDTDENILVAVGWQDICTRFHRTHPVAGARCRESDSRVKKHLHDLGGDYLDYRCGNGLREAAVPIIINGEHLATLFTGQFFYDDEQPDPEFFRAQAEEFDFDTDDYLAALSRVPVCSREQIRNIMNYYCQLVKVMAETGLKNLRLTREVAERKQAEKALEGSRDYLTKILNSIADPIFVKDREHRLVLVNDAECSLAGRSREELIGRTDYDFFPKDQVDVFWQKDEIVFETGQENINEEEITDAQGRKRVIVTKKTLYRDLLDSPFIVGIIRDVTELKQIEQALRTLNEELESRVAARTSELASLNADLLKEIGERRQTEQRLALMNFALDNVGEAAYLMDEQSRFRYVNEESCRALGYGRGELLAMSVADIDPHYPLEAWSGVWRNLKLHDSVTLETEHRTIHGTRFPVEINLNYIEFDGHGYCMALARDITERKRAEQELRSRQQQLVELNDTLEKRVEEEVATNRAKDLLLIQQNRQAALGEMLDHIAHQWKQPINSISLIVQDMERAWTFEELTGEYISDAVHQTMDILIHMSQTIGVFRDFYLPDKERAVFGVGDAVHAALTFIMPSLRFDAIGVECEADAGLTAVGYHKEYTQVLLNILGNARNALLENKAPDPVIRIRAFAERGMAVVTITDNAGGIPEMLMEKIFDLYVTTRKALGGTGIGLYMSKNIIEINMGGALSVRNVPGGAQFRIEIPHS
jgi:PAS domain S-box-containing protein